MFIGKTKRQHTITGLDIGTTKVCAIVGRAEPDGGVTILGMGSCPSRGLICGEITEINPTIDAICRAVNQAVEVANVGVGDVYVGIAGDHIRSKNVKAAVEIRHPTRGIDEKDRFRAVQKASEVSLSDDEALIHAVVQEFTVNGRRVVHDPVGLSSSMLEVHTHLVTSNVDSLNNIIRCVRRAGLRHPQVVLQSMASSMSCVSPHELELGCVLVDIGGGTTDVAISVDGAIRATREFDLGGDRITRDIAEVIPCSLNDAENVKKRHGCALPGMVERGRTFQVPSLGDYTQTEEYEEYALAEIIEARLEDILQIVDQFVSESGYRGRLHAGAILTGGTAILEGITDVAERILEMKCHTAAPRGLKGFAPVVSSPIYSTGVGLILYGLEHERRGRNYQRGGFRRLFEYMVDNFT